MPPPPPQAGSSYLARAYDDESSSLDPLADALDAYKSPAATRRLGSPVNISIVANSPTRTVTEKTLSPWKVRVTVEAEPEDADARVTDLDIVVLGDDADSDEWTARKTAAKNKNKKRRSAGRTDRSVSVTSETPSNENAVFAIHNDQDEGVDVAEAPTIAASSATELRQIDLNRVSVRPRALSIKQQEQSLRKVSAGSAMSYPTPSPTSSYHGDNDRFTMIDLDSIPSATRFRSTPAVEEASDNNNNSGPGPAVETTHDQPVPEARPEPRYKLVVDDETELSSTVPSSPPPITRNCDDSSLIQIPRAAAPAGLRKVTPLQGQYFSPRLPSPPPLFRSSQRGRGHQRTISKEALHAGRRELYDGFSSGTQRELRAGLRFGEQLAKTQTQAQEPSPLYPQLPQENKVQSRENEQLLEKDDPRDETPGERRWQIEGESENTGPTQVMVIGDDDEEVGTAYQDEDDDGGDIWLEEAKAGSSSPREELDHQQHEAKHNKPRRNLLPSPWKRGEDINPSTFLSPVKFAQLGKDSTLLHLTVDQLTRLSPLAAQQCPPTPRSAMKGARFSAAGANESPRKVVFNARSRYLNEDGEESTMSAKLDSRTSTSTSRHQSRMDALALARRQQHEETS
ncbi:hypothetical protein DV738_g3347, partial [Chaetothyriales sp. CBS 135597]